MRVFMTRVFERFARKEGLAEERLCEAIARAERGVVDADLGGSLIKQRVARPGRGRSGGYRTVVAFRTAHRSVFLYGFAKNERDNIDDIELADFKKLAKHFLGYTEEQIAKAMKEAELKEVPYADQDEEHDG
ncbi:MAG: type II toxin-antitoxin system RelE/ParE family toxin [Methylacidiphilales bacterium]|nr:type II toxin-antitoxin system RelE/ParE family toxin [Candidatus Methylacidiphilales bacterium]